MSVREAYRPRIRQIVDLSAGFPRRLRGSSPTDCGMRPGAVFEGPFGTVTDCDVLLDRLLAEGFGNLTNTDNDLAAFLRESTNANAFGFTAQANNLELVGGGQAKYNGVSRCVWDGNTGEDLFHCKDKINFH